MESSDRHPLLHGRLQSRKSMVMKALIGLQSK